MNSPKPPALATWLLEHLAQGENKEALAGDLLEQFEQGRSIAWFWRQVLAAVGLTLLKEWRILWVAMGFTVVWLGILSQFYGRILIIATTAGVWGWGIRLPWPESLISPVGFFTAINALPLPVAVGVYLVMTKSFSLRRLLRGLLVGLFTLPPAILLALLLLSAVSHHVPNALVIAVASLPLLFALLLSILAAVPRAEFGAPMNISF